jgi:hypothetical protein
MGMARLQMITQRATLNFRGLFKGIDSKPLERAYLRLTDMFSMSSTNGRMLSGLLTRGFNGFFSAIEKAEPYVEAFADGVLLAGTIAENALWRARIAVFPFTNALSKTIDKTSAMSGIAYGTAAALVYLGARAVVAGAAMVGRLALGAVAATAKITFLGVRAVATGAIMAGRFVFSLAASTAGLMTTAGAATAAAAPFVALAAAIGAVVLAADQFSKLSKEWDKDVLLRSIGIGESDADRMNRQYDKEAVARKAAGKPSLVRAAAPGELGTRADGQKSGEAMGAGLVAGLSVSEAAARAAGVSLAKAADAGVRAGAEIRSPSRKMQRNAEYMGEGAEKGLRASAPRVERAARESLVPSLRGGLAASQQGAAGGQGGGLADAKVVHLHFEGNIYAGSGNRQEVQDDMMSGLKEAFSQATIVLGGAAA